MDADVTLVRESLSNLRVNKSLKKKIQNDNFRVEKLHRHMELIPVLLKRILLDEGENGCEGWCKDNVLNMIKLCFLSSHLVRKLLFCSFLF